eukprot:5603002-Alexandrium_andersonii.AAC.1
MASSTRPNFRRASRQSCRPPRTSRSRKTSMSVTGLHTRSRTSSRCAGFTSSRLHFSHAADLSPKVSRSAFQTRT